MERRIKTGDTVIVVVPNIFKRCGYPMDFHEECRRIEQNEKDLLDKLYRTAFPPEPPCDVISQLRVKGEPYHEAKCKQFFAKGLAFSRVGQSKMGGVERTIHTMHNERYRGKIMYVQSVKTCMTGVYYPPWSEQDSYTGEWDSAPGGLEDRKSHRILEISPSGGFMQPTTWDASDGTEYDFEGRLWIEDCWCELSTDTDD